MFFFFQAEDGIRAAQESRGLGDVYKRQAKVRARHKPAIGRLADVKFRRHDEATQEFGRWCRCLLYTSDAADDLLCVDLGGRRIIKKKKN